MTLRNFQGTPAFEPGEQHETPEQRRALDHLFSLTYEELRRLASTVKRGDPGITLSPTALVNEAWIKLAKTPNGYIAQNQLIACLQMLTSRSVLPGSRR